jgi:hypothetical protein
MAWATFLVDFFTNSFFYIFYKQLFTLGCFLKMTTVAHIFGLLFSIVKVIHWKWVRLHLGRFFHKHLVTLPVLCRTCRWGVAPRENVCSGSRRTERKRRRGRSRFGPTCSISDGKIIASQNHLFSTIIFTVSTFFTSPV